MSRVFALVQDLQVLPGNRIPAAAVGHQLVHQLVLARQGQAEPGLSAVGEAQLPPLAHVALPSLAGLSRFGAQRQQPLPQEAVEKLVAGGTVLSQHQDVRGSAHRVPQELFLVAGEGDAAEVTWKQTEGSVNQQHRPSTPHQLAHRLASIYQITFRERDGKNLLLKSNFIAQEFLENVPFIPPFPELYWLWHGQRNILRVTADAWRDLLTDASLVRYGKLTSPSRVTRGHPQRLTHDPHTADCEMGVYQNDPPLSVHSERIM